MPDQSLCVIDLNTLKGEYQKVEMGEIDLNERRKMYFLFKKAGAVLEETNFWNLRRFIELIKG